jgi:hypothetical protein
MKRRNIQQMTIDQLVERFAEIGIAQEQAILYDEHGKYNRLYKQMDAVDNELRARGPEARRSLLQLYSHPNAQVRLKAAVRTLGVAPEPARQLLDVIRTCPWLPQALDAGMMIRGLDNGTFKPD